MPTADRLPGYQFVEYLNHRDIERSRCEAIAGLHDASRIASVNSYWMQVQYAMAMSALLNRRIFLRDAHAPSGSRVMGSFLVREVHPSRSLDIGLFSLIVASDIGAEEIALSVRLDTYLMYCK